jgi:hypothetical protein
MAGNEELSYQAQSPWEGERPVVSEKSDHACKIFYLGAKILASWRFVACNCWSRLKTAVDWKARLSRGCRS